ncbi:Sortase family protein [Actinosynnema pretiosum]|nr:Sortase family protein [Actinosynnema pretiosum]
MRRIGSAVAVLATAAALLSGCAASDVAPPAPTSPPLSTSVTASTATAPSADVARPTGVRVPKLGVSSSLVDLGLNPDGTVQVPPVEQPEQAGWFTGAPRPGEPGPAVVLGHVNGGGRAGVFSRLHELVAGDEVLVDRAGGGTARFAVTRVDRVAKDGFPTEQVYGDTQGPELRLITCGGEFDESARGYRDNVIAYAVLLP